jgi:hypothetical protein
MLARAATPNCHATMLGVGNPLSRRISREDGMKTVGAIFTAIVPLTLCLFPLKGLAGDYKFYYAIDVRGVAKAGEATECSYGIPCEIQFEEPRYNIYINHIYIDLIIDSDPNKPFRVTIHGEYGEEGCCYFSGGDTGKSISSNNKVDKLEIFQRGYRTRRKNAPAWYGQIGTLSLSVRRIDQ